MDAAKRATLALIRALIETVYEFRDTGGVPRSVPEQVFEAQRLTHSQYLMIENMAVSAGYLRISGNLLIITPAGVTLVEDIKKILAEEAASAD